MIKPILIILILAGIIAGLGYGLYYFNFLNKDNTDTSNNEIIDIPDNTEQNISKEDSNIINTKKGDKFLVVLDSNPTTGYQWEANVDSDYIKLDDKSFNSESSEEMVGAGGYETFNFTALESGETEITFSYLRPWEEGVEPVEKKVYNIIIE